MNLSIGIVGLPNIGKSSLFNALTKQSVPAENYPFCTIDPSVGIVPVPDERLALLSRFSDSAKTIPAAVEFTDIAGLVKGASVGEGLGNQFLANIREVDAVAQVVRVFKSSAVTHVHGDVNPLHDIEVINLELILADEQTVAKRLSSLERETKSGAKEALEEQRIATRVLEVLRAGRRAEHAILTAEERARIRHLNLLTLKPVLYVLNVSDASDIPQELLSFLEHESAVWVALDIATEREIAGLPDDEAAALRAELGAPNEIPRSGGDSVAISQGAQEEGLKQLISKSYALLGLITFFTTGKDETRAWTIRTGATAPEAGAAIHSDFQEKFIRADVIHWKTLLDAGSCAHARPMKSREAGATVSPFHRAREQGLVRTEGKEYVVQDGDVIEFKI